MKENSKESMSDKVLNLNLEVEGLSKKQLRLIQSLNFNSLQIVKSIGEKELFESSYEMLESWVALIRSSNLFLGVGSSQEHTKQVLEYCLDEMSVTINNMSRSSKIEN